MKRRYLKPNKQQKQSYQPQMKSVEDISRNGLLNNKAKDELYKITKKEQGVNRDTLVYKTSRIFNFQYFKTVRSFRRGIMNGTITLNNAQETIKICYLLIK